MNKTDEWHAGRGAIDIREVGVLLCEALGLDPGRVRAVTIRNSPGPATATVEYFLLDENGKKYFVDEKEQLETLTLQVRTA